MSDWTRALGVDGPPSKQDPAEFAKMSQILNNTAEDWHRLIRQVDRFAQGAAGEKFTGQAAHAFAALVGQLTEELRPFPTKLEDAADLCTDHASRLDTILSNSDDLLRRSLAFLQQRDNASATLAARRQDVRQATTSLNGADPATQDSLERDLRTAERRADSADNDKRDAVTQLAKCRTRHQELRDEARTLDNQTSFGIDSISFPEITMARMEATCGGATQSNAWVLIQTFLAYNGVLVLSDEEQAEVDARLEAIRKALDDDWRGVTSGDMDRIGDAFEDLSPAQLDALLGAMTDEELARFYGEMQQHSIKGGWSDEEIDNFHLLIGENVSLDTWRRLGQFSDLIDPDPGLALSDSARGNAPQSDIDYVDSLTYQDWSQHALFDTTGQPDPLAIKQGQIGDCYLIAGLIGVALVDPSLISDSISANANGTYTVTFGDGSKQVVSADIATDPSGNSGFVRPQGEVMLWAPLIEKAYAQKYGGFDDIVGGHSSTAVENLTGREGEKIDEDDISLEQLAERLNDGEILGIGTIHAGDGDRDAWLEDPSTPDIFREFDDDYAGPPDDLPQRPTEQRLKPGHAFVVVDVDVSGGTVSVLNPWYPNQDPVVMTERQFYEGVNNVHAN